MLDSNSIVSIVCILQEIVNLVNCGIDFAVWLMLSFQTKQLVLIILNPYFTKIYFLIWKAFQRDSPLVVDMSTAIHTIGLFCKAV